jgi:hypothetical protein
MSLLIYITAVVVGIVFRRQELRHLAEENKEYTHLHIAVPLRAPRLRGIESGLTVWIGMFLAAIGGFSLAALFEIPTSVNNQEIITATSFFLASGLALVIVGGAAVRQNLLFRRSVAAAQAAS